MSAGLEHVDTRPDITTAVMTDYFDKDRIAYRVEVPILEGKRKACGIAGTREAALEELVKFLASAMFCLKEDAAG